MSVSEQQTDLEEVVDELREFEAGDTVRLVTDAGGFTARVTATEWHADGATVTFEDREDDRRVRVSTEWYGGWLDPLVDADAHAADADARVADGADNDAELRRPIGTLVDVYLVAAAADQPRHSGRP